MRRYQSINPENNEILASFELDSPSSLESKIETASIAFSKNKVLQFQERANLMLSLSKILFNRSEEISNLITLEMGKLKKESVSEVKKVIDLIEYFSTNGLDFISHKDLITSHQKTEKIYQPLGIIYGIMPWNFPFWQALRFAIPTILAGNVVVVKHSECVPQSAQLIEDCFLEAGFSIGFYQNILIDFQQSEQLIQNPKIKGVSITGSTNAGREVAGISGKVIKKTVLELGGSDPFIVLKDADLQRVVDLAIQARFQNNGQTCVAGKRFIVQKEIFDEFTSLFLEKVKTLKIGSPFNQEVQIGPIARADLLDGLIHQIEIAVQEGEELILGGKRIDSEGNFIEPTIFISTNVNSVLRKEELFGPVATLISANNPMDAINIANETEFGLGASLWTKDLKLASELAPLVESGIVHINSIVKSEPNVPFGGMKNSGLGKELGMEGMLEFTSLKVIHFDE